MFTSSDAIIIRHLLKYGQTAIYDFHEEYMLSPAQIINSLRRLKNLRICNFNDDNAYITDVGLEQIVRYRRQIFRRAKVWKDVPLCMRQQAFSERESYIPSFRKIDKRILRE